MKDMMWYFIMFIGVFMASGQNNRENLPEKDIGQKFTAYVMDCVETQDMLLQDIPTIMMKAAQDEKTMHEIESELQALPKERVSVCIENGDLDTSKVADELARCWNKYRGRNHYAVSVMYAGEDEKREDAMTSFFSLLEDECKAVFEENWVDAERFPSYIRLERLNGLDIYTFHPDVLNKGDDKEYLVILNGTWEGQEVSWQPVIFPGTWYVFTNTSYDMYCTTQADVNYDGCGDLLIKEGHSGGSGGSWTNYRALIWKAETGKFAWYESFPDQISSLDFEKGRIIESWRNGASREYVFEYKVVDGEYVEARKLAWERGILSYYEMGVLIRQHDVTDLTYEDICALYPDLDYWSKG